MIPPTIRLTASVRQPPLSSTIAWLACCTVMHGVASAAPIRNKDASTTEKPQLAPGNQRPAAAASASLTYVKVKKIGVMTAIIVQQGESFAGRGGCRRAQNRREK